MTRLRPPTPSASPAAAAAAPPPGQAPVSGSQLLQSDGEMRVTEHAGRIFVITVHVRLTRGLLARALQIIWRRSSWRQPWGLVVELPEGTTYDSDVRKHEMPPDDRRAVGTAVITSNPVHRMVISSIGIAYRAVSRFVISAHSSLADGISAQRALVVQAEADNRRY
jgi:hypothetical protein